MANDYLDEVTFVAIAGRGGLDAARERAETLFSDNVLWGLDDSIWELYGVPGQPASVLVTDGVIVDVWFGQLAEPEMRKRLDNLVALSS
ncbi:MAG: hypothetical protein BMS9Abin12_1521 [Acidimicrobiia bacterium]|nr:MAG: hypothetical protein BMS9Abin12_1521 [Acidimicrobiia bacterium]